MPSRCRETQDNKEGGVHVSYCIVGMLNICQQIFIALVFVLSCVLRDGTRRVNTSTSECITEEETPETCTSARLV